ncbi:MAG: hypothetical protein K8R59_07215, partial [Thermoanaerobaculales bacterium]|nr:hypothetical protein [Thermoanaerobaculales bacterium]
MKCRKCELFDVSAMGLTSVRRSQRDHTSIGFWISCVAAAGLVLLITVSGWAQVTPLGDAFVYHTNPSGYLLGESGVALRVDGYGFLTYCDILGRQIRGGWYDAAGARFGSEIVINDYDSTIYPRYSETAREPSIDGAVVVWLARDETTKAAEADKAFVNGRILARRVSGLGGVLGAEVQISDGSAVYPLHPDVAAWSGGIVVTWLDSGSTGSEDDRIWARILSSDLVPATPPFQVSQVHDMDLVAPDIEVDSEGNFLVMWNASIPNYWERRARLFAADGSPRSDEWTVQEL